MTGPSRDAEADEQRAAQAGCRLTGLLSASRQARVHAAERPDGMAVLKVATRATMADPVGRARFAREGRLGLDLHHPNLVRTLAHGEDWVLLADLRGPMGRPPADLRDVGRSPAFVPRLASVAAALAHLHARGLVHRDVKPANILIDPRGEPVLIDLGIIGLRSGDGLGLDEIAGSLAWMAPEQIRGASPQPDADAWSLAAVIGFVACGVPPFDGTADAVLERRRNGRGPDDVFLEGVHAIPDPVLRDLVAAGLSDAARARPSMPEIVRRLQVIAPVAAPEP